MALLDFLPWGGAISKGLDLLKSLFAMGERKENRNEGAIAQDDKTKGDTLETLECASAPVGNDERERLWDNNTKRFGPSDGGSGD